MALSPALCRRLDTQARTLGIGSPQSSRHGRCAGAATTDIIEQYVSTIRALREVDPSGVLLEAVSDPIREYLRCRKARVSMDPHPCRAARHCKDFFVCWTANQAQKLYLT